MSEKLNKQPSQKNKSKFFAVFFAVISILLAVALGFASVNISNTNDEISKLKQEVESQSDVIAYFKDSNKEIPKLESEIKSQADTITKLENESEKKSSELKQMSDELEKAKKDAQQWENKYNSLKTTFESDDTKKVCYLTFDDGPSDNTLKIIDILNKYNVKATFFVIARSKTEYMKNIVDSGNAIALHSYSHDYNEIYKDADSYFKDLSAISDLVKAKTGVESKIIRFPGGSSNTVGKVSMKTLCDMVENKGYAYFDWNCDSGDARSNKVPADEILANIKKDVGSQKSLTVLMHDTAAKTSTVEALPSVIEYLKSKGYTFGVLSEYTEPCHHNIGR